MEKDRKYYQKLLKVEKDYKLMTINFLQSFLGGGIISFIGQVVFTIYYKILSFDLDNSRLFMTLTIILLSGILSSNKLEIIIFLKLSSNSLSLNIS